MDLSIYGILDTSIDRSIISYTYMSIYQPVYPYLPLFISIYRFLSLSISTFSILKTLCISGYLYLSIYLSICLSTIYLSIYLSSHTNLYINRYLSIHIYIFTHVHLHTYIHTCIRLLARMTVMAKRLCTILLVHLSRYSAAGPRLFGGTSGLETPRLPNMEAYINANSIRRVPYHNYTIVHPKAGF